MLLALKMGGEGPKPKNVSCLERLERTREWNPLESPESDTALRALLPSEAHFDLASHGTVR